MLDYFIQIIEKTQLKETITNTLESFIEVGGGKLDQNSYTLMVNKKNLLDIENIEE